MGRTRATRCFFLVIMLVLVGAANLFAGEFIVYYERVIKDAAGNEIGFQKQRIDSWTDLPEGGHWRTFMTQLVGVRTMYDYAAEVARQLGKPMILTLSDRNNVSTTSKTSSGFQMNLYKHITQYSSQSSQRYVFLHELGHVAMLNAYPASYNFSGLDYGDDNRHYLDEILPNTNTAWVEGWANAFAALKNGGMVFSLNMNSDSIVSFLKDNSFESMTRNELFTGKILFDACNRLENGQNKVFNALARSGPHYSIKDFCKSYVQIYPQDQIGLAEILNRNSSGRISLNEMLDYVNNGSRTVSRGFYNFLQANGKLNSVPTTTNTANPGTGTTNSTPKESFWSRIVSFFAGIFGKKTQQPVASGPATSMIVDLSGSQPGLAQQPLPPEEPESSIPWGQVLTSPADDSAGMAAADGAENLEKVTAEDLAKAQEAYYQAFADYNRLLANERTDSQKILEAKTRLYEVKAALNAIKRAIRQQRSQ